MQDKSTPSLVLSSTGKCVSSGCGCTPGPDCRCIECRKAANESRAKELWEKALKLPNRCNHKWCHFQVSNAVRDGYLPRKWCQQSAEELNEERATLLAKKEMDNKERKLAAEARQLDNLDRMYEAATSDSENVPDVVTLDDLTAVFDDEIDLTPTPAILDRRHGDGGLVLPAGKLNWVYGLPAGGKSFIGEIAVSEAVLRGGRAMFLDYEDNKRTFHQRAAILGFNPKMHTELGSFRYIHGGIADYPTVNAEAQDWLSQADDVEMSLVVIDAAESSGCPSDGASVNEWLGKVVDLWERLGVTVIVLDHIPKQKEGRPDGPIGSQRKMAAITGIGLKVTGNCWSKTKNGRLTLLCQKDRTGNYAKSEKVAAIVGEWDSSGYERVFGYRIVNPTQGDDDTGNIGGDILDYVAGEMPEGAKSKRQISSNVKGKNTEINSTIDALVEGGLLAQKGNTYTLTDSGFSLLSDS